MHSKGAGGGCESARLSDHSQIAFFIALEILKVQAPFGVYARKRTCRAKAEMYRPRERARSARERGVQ